MMDKETKDFLCRTRHQSKPKTSTSLTGVQSRPPSLVSRTLEAHPHTGSDIGTLGKLWRQ